MRDERLNAVMNNLLPQVKELVSHQSGGIVYVAKRGHLNRTTGEFLIDSITIEVMGGIYYD